MSPREAAFSLGRVVTGSKAEGDELVEPMTSEHDDRHLMLRHGMSADLTASLVPYDGSLLVQRLIEKRNAARRQEAAA